MSAPHLRVEGIFVKVWAVHCCRLLWPVGPIRQRPHDHAWVAVPTPHAAPQRPLAMKNRMKDATVS
eukprot:scaffold24518_cov35-Prasinocladus_malaysianus.AAC.1